MKRAFFGGKFDDNGGHLVAVIEEQQPDGTWRETRKVRWVMTENLDAIAEVLAEHAASVVGEPLSPPTTIPKFT